MRRTFRRAATLVTAIACASMSACTLSEDTDTAAVGEGSIERIDSLDGVQVKVGSKEFDEQLLLGQIAIVALQAAGGDPVDRTNITGSNNVRKALTSGNIGLYWEYTGTAWITYLQKTKKIPDPEELYQAVKKADAANGITWWARSPANNTYAIAANPDAAEETGVETLSDYAELASTDPEAARICMGSEFNSRDDGFPGVQKAYDFQLPDEYIVEVQDAVVYTNVGAGEECSFGAVAATDGRIVAQDLVILEDDQGFFPVYNPAVSIRTPLAEEHPELEEVFTAIAEKLDTETLTALNERVSVDGEEPNTVAREWMKEQGFIG